VRGLGAKWSKRLLLAAMLCAGLALLRVPSAALDLSVGPGSARALLRIGFASIRIAFDSGQACPKADGCAGAVPPRSLINALPGAAGTAVARS